MNTYKCWNFIDHFDFLNPTGDRRSVTPWMTEVYGHRHVGNRNLSKLKAVFGVAHLTCLVAFISSYTSKLSSVLKK